MAEARAARLAATEARLSGITSSTASASTDPASSTNTDINKESSWKPSDKGDLEKKKEFTKLLYRGVVRDNGYREASVCVDVSRSLFLLLIYLTLGNESWTMVEVAWVPSSGSGSGGDGSGFSGTVGGEELGCRIR